MTIDRMGNFSAPLRAAACLAVLLSHSGCAYLNHRARDASDILTLSGETNTYGASIQVLPIQLGVGYGRGQGYGLRSGAMGPYEFEDRHLLVVGEKKFDPEEERGQKAYDLSYIAGATLLDSKPQPWQRFLQIEAALGFGVGVRAGLNIGELLDFLIGLTTVDIAHDDR